MHSCFISIENTSRDQQILHVRELNMARLMLLLLALSSVGLVSVYEISSAFSSPCSLKKHSTSRNGHAILARKAAVCGKATSILIAADQGWLLYVRSSRDRCHFYWWKFPIIILGMQCPWDTVFHLFTSLRCFCPLFKNNALDLLPRTSSIRIQKDIQRIPLWYLHS